MIGTNVSHYTIEAELGRGGMGVVYLAVDTRLGRNVALKFLPAGLESDELARQRFVQEARAASSLEHPNICAVHDIGEDDNGRTFIAMGYYPGRTLDEVISDGGPISTGRATSIARQIAAGLSGAHDRGIVHRDIKPSNILVGDDGIVRILDFGLAKLVGSVDITRDGSTVGTAAYMSPEQARGDEVDHRTDIWSLAVVLYEMLTGVRPYRGDYEQAVVYSILNESPDTDSLREHQIPRTLSEVILRCLSKTRNDRWSSMRDVHAALKPFAEGDEVFVSALAGGSSSGVSVLRMAVLFSLASLVMLALLYALMIGLGLPGWVFPAGVALLLVGFPIVLVAGQLDRRKARLGSSSASFLSRLMTVRRAAMGGLFAFGGLALFVAAYMLSRSMGIGPAATLVSKGDFDRQDQLIVADFVGNTSDETIAASVAEALRIDLAQSPTIRVVDNRTILQRLRQMDRPTDSVVDNATATEIAIREGATAVVTGRVDQVGSAYQLSLRLVTTGGETLLSLRETAEDDSKVVPAVDRISASLRERIGESIKDIRASVPLERVTTSSLDALRLYTEADQKYSNGDYESAVPLLEEALARDSTFAMAYRKLAVSLNNLGIQASRARQAATTAFEMRHNLPPIEAELAKAYYYNAVLYDADKEIAAYKTVLERDPYNPIALNNLALKYRERRMYVEAESLAVRAIQKWGDSTTYFFNAIHAQAAQGAWDRAIATQDIYRDKINDAPTAALMLGEILYSKRDFDAADSVVAEVISNPPNSFIGSWLDFVHGSGLLTRGRYHDASEYLSRSTRTTLQRRSWETYAEDVSYHTQVQAIVLQDPDEALNLLEGIWDVVPVDSLHKHDRPYWLAFLFADLGKRDRAEELMALMERDWAGTLDGVSSLPLARAILLAQDGAIDASLEFFDKAYEESECSACGWIDFRRAVALDRADRLDEAIEYYRRVVDQPSATRIYADAIYLAPTLTRLADVYERNNQIDKAIEYYQWFLDLWEDADPVLQPRIDEARQNLDRLLLGSSRDTPA